MGQIHWVDHTHSVLLRKGQWERNKDLNRGYYVGNRKDNRKVQGTRASFPHVLVNKNIEIGTSWE